MLLLSVTGLLRASDDAAIHKDDLDSFVQETIEPAYRDGSREVVWRELTNLLPRFKDNIEPLDELLRRQGLPETATLLADLRFSPGQQALPKASRIEVRVILSGIQRQIEEQIAARDQLFILNWADSPITSFERYHKIGWDTHVYRNELANAESLAIAASQLQNEYKAELNHRGFYQFVDFQGKRRRMYRMRLELHERELAMKADRLRLAAKTLESSEANVESQLWAAHAILKDGDTWLRALRETKSFQFQPKLNSKQVKSEIRRNVRQGRKSAGRELLTKSRQFFDGLHWWFRGRYGRGTHNGGMLKPPAAGANPKFQLALIMPKKRPAPTNPADFIPASILATKTSDSHTIHGSGLTKTPDYERRHHYAWSQKPPLFAKLNYEMHFH